MMKKIIRFKDQGEGCLGLGALLTIAGISGWVMCLVKFIKCDFDVPLKAEVIYGIGVFTGLGAIFGWFNVGK